MDESDLANNVETLKTTNVECGVMFWLWKKTCIRLQQSKRTVYMAKPKTVEEGLILLVNKYQNLCGNGKDEQFSSLASNNSLELIKIPVYLSYKNLLQ